MAQNDPRRQEWGLVALLSVIAVVGVGIATITVDVNESHLGGGDAANYANAGEQYASARPAGREFLPPELQPPDGELIDADQFAKLVRPGWESPRNGIMTSFVFVSRDGGVLYPHSHLSPRVSALIERAGGSAAVPFLGFGYLAVATVLMGYVVWSVTASRMAAAMASVAYFVLPSHLDLARYPMSEPLTVVLVLTTVVGVLRLPRQQVALALLPLALLAHARDEFALCVLVSIFVLCAVRPRWWSVVAGVLVVTSWLRLTAGATSPMPLRSFTFEPTSTWPTPSTIADVLARPGRAGSLALPAALLGLALGLIDPLRAAIGMALSHAAGVVRARPWIPVAVIALVVAVGDVLKSRMDPGQTLLAGVIRQARFSTGWLLWESTGLLVILGVVGLVIALPALVDRFGLVGGAWLLPLLAVFVDMHATPANPLWWTRRFHLLVYPALVLGAAVAALAGWRWMRNRVPRAVACSVAGILVVALIAAQVALTGGRYPEQEGELSARALERTHGALASLPAESVILYGYDGAAQKLQHLSRTFHGHYSFVVWDPSDTESVVADMVGTGRPVFVDEFLIDRAELAGVWTPELVVPSEVGFREIPLGRIGAPADRPV